MYIPVWVYAEGPNKGHFFATTGVNSTRVTFSLEEILEEEAYRRSFEAEVMADLQYVVELDTGKAYTVERADGDSFLLSPYHGPSSDDWL